MHDEALLKKMQSLLRVTTERGASQAEMENAMSLAMKLSLKHGIRLEDVALAEAEELTKEEMVEKTHKTAKGLYRRPPADKYLSAILQRFFKVSIIHYGDWSRASEIMILGRKSDVDFAIYVYNYLRDEFNRLWRKARREQDLPMNARNSFFQGLYYSLADKLTRTQGEAKIEVQEELKMDSSKYHLMVVSQADELKKELHERHPYLEKARDTWNQNANHYEGHELGRNHGQNININKPLK